MRSLVAFLFRLGFGACAPLTMGAPTDSGSSGGWDVPSQGFARLSTALHTPGGSASVMAAAVTQSFYVFGYGSLVWRPGDLPYTSR